MKTKFFAKITISYINVNYRPVILYRPARITSTDLIKLVQHKELDGGYQQNVNGCLLYIALSSQAWIHLM